MPRTISLQVPPDAEPGDALTFVVEGKEMEIPIPYGSQQGDILEIQIEVDDAEDHNDQDDNSTVEILLENGRTLHFESSLKNQEMRGAKDHKRAQLKDTINDGTYAHPWPAGLAMSKFWGSTEAKQVMHSLFTGSDSKDPSDGVVTKSAPESLSVLELGSGLGLVGIALAAQYAELTIGSSLPTLGKIILSDVEDAMPLLQHNLERNESSLQHVVEAVPFLWTKEATAAEKTILVPPDNGFDLLVVSDVLYNTESIPPLVATLKRHLAEKSSLLLAVRWRKPDLERSFFEELEGWKGKQWHLVHTMQSPLSWKEYGNPKCKASNLYFHQTMITVQGKQHSLAEILQQNETNDSSNNTDAAINKELQEQMTDKEAEAFENCHIQIYCLSRKNVGTIPSELGDVTDSRKRPRLG